MELPDRSFPRCSKSLSPTEFSSIWETSLRSLNQLASDDTDLEITDTVNVAIKYIAAIDSHSHRVLMTWEIADGIGCDERA